MKPTDLQIRDWVSYIGKDFNDYVDRVSGMIEGCVVLDKEMIHRSIDNIHPIPLTDKILEKNFEKYNGNYIFSDDFFYFEIHEYNDGMWMLSYEISEMSLPNTQIANICYVHELQHALRLCGLNELADNFKVEE